MSERREPALIVQLVIIVTVGAVSILMGLSRNPELTFAITISICGLAVAMDLYNRRP